MPKLMTIRIEPKRTPLVEKTVEILKRELAARGVRKVVELEPQPDNRKVPAGSGRSRKESATTSRRPDLILEICSGIGKDGFRIEGDGVKLPKRITGNDERGLLYGVGKYLRGCSFGKSADDFRHSPWTGVSLPKCQVRGIYFASHFHNFYHDAPIRKIEQYVEELALWGCNTLAVWYDMHHFNGIKDPAAQKMIKRLRAILTAANAVGITGALTALGNEGYANSPEEMRADWTAGHDGYFAAPGGHYHVEICPNKPGGLEQILKDRREMLEAFAGLDIGYVWNWPYDQGGCTCSKCTPWGGNGFLKVAKPYAEVVKSIMPDAKVILSTWYFDHFVHGEWERFAKEIGKKKPVFADYLMVDDSGDKFPEFPLKRGVPGGLPMLNFPEISMYAMFPWGGYGANPLPKHIQHIWNQAGARLSGGFPYSEGIFDDLNKAVSLQHYWCGRDAEDTIREYASAIASPALADELTSAILQMERQHHHSPAKLPSGKELKQKLYPKGGGESCLVAFNADRTAGAEECEKKMRSIDLRMSKSARKSWRWRILFLRASIDAEIARSGGRMTAAMDKMLEELVEIFHAHNAEMAVCPLSRRSLRRLNGG